MNLTFSQSQLERPAILLPLALLLLAAAAGLTWSNLAARTDAPLSVPPPTAVTVLASRRDLPQGGMIEAADLVARQMSTDKAPPDAVHAIGAAQGHVTLAAIPAGKTILQQDVSTEAATGLAVRVPQSYRAYSVPVSEADIAGGLIQTGDRVDLYVTLPSALFADAGHGDRSKSSLLLQAVQVLAVGIKLKNDSTPSQTVRTVTLALSSADLAKVALAARLGSISFAVRNPADDELRPQGHAVLPDLVAGGSMPTPPGPAAPPHASRPAIAFYAGRDRTQLSPP